MDETEISDSKSILNYIKLSFLRMKAKTHLQSREMKLI